MPDISSAVLHQIASVRGMDCVRQNPSPSRNASARRTFFPANLIQRKDDDALKPYLPRRLFPWSTTMIIDLLSREHRNIERLLAVLEHELDIFDRAARPDYEVIRAIVAYFEVYTELYHHPQEDQVFAKLKLRDPASAADIGDLAREHQKGSERLRRVARTVDHVLAGGEILRGDVDAIVREFLEHERHHMAMEDRHFFAAAEKALKPDDWAEIASARSAHKDPLFSDATETRFDALRAHIFELEREAEAERR
jgi:hemerythrin-like domain-containing protein